MTDRLPAPHLAGLAASVDEGRQWARLMGMAMLGAIPGDGVNRAALTELDRQARRLLIEWATEAGLTVTIDEMANLFLRHEGTDPGAEPVLTGSHMDSQPSGGRFDGIWGVVAALEAVQAIRESDLTTRRPIEVVAWTNEEGGRFAPGCMGSMAWAGHSAPSTWDNAKDPDGITFRAALDEQLALEADLPRRPLGPVGPHRPVAYVEAHIEQGPRLEADMLDIGVVTGIQGSRWFAVDIIGRSAHAGTAPVSLRQDAVQDMVRAINALNELTEDPSDVLRFTVGRVEVHPNTSNSVADHVRFTIDLRHPDAALLREKGDSIAPTIRAALRHCTATVTERFNAAPSVFPALVPDAVESAAHALGLRSLRMPSGAFHDAQFMAAVCPTGMIFVPSKDGVSHNPAEYTSPEQLAAGTRVLAATVFDLANR